MSVSDTDLSDSSDRAIYDQKQRDEPIPMLMRRSEFIGSSNGGCASVGTEVWTKSGEWRYCRNPHKCKAAGTMARIDNRSREQQQGERQMV